MLKKVLGLKYKLFRAFFPNPLDQLLKKAKKQNHFRFLIAWNRGLGDIPLGLYTLCQRIWEFIPHAEITFLTREELLEGFQLLAHVKIVVVPSWKRGKTVNMKDSILEAGLRFEDFDRVLEKPDPTRWLSWQLGKVVPKLKWQAGLEKLAEGFHLPVNCIGVHVQTETEAFYGYEKNWPLEKWQQLFLEITKKTEKKIILFGLNSQPKILIEGVIDLRGKTSLYEMMAIVKNHCEILIVPDSGILSLLYYLNAQFPLKIISLWADPRQGVLKQNVSSPNLLLEHIPLLGKEEKVEAISVEEVMQAAFGNS